MNFHEKRILNNPLILKIQRDETLNLIFRSLSKNPDDLYKYLQVIKKSLLTLNDDEIFRVIKNFWLSIVKVSKLSLNDLQSEFSITKKTSLKIIFSTWFEILEYSQTHNFRYNILDEEYFDIAAEFLCSSNGKTIHTLASYIQPNKKKLDKRYSSLEFWKTSPKRRKKSDFITISDFSSSDKQPRLINLIKFGLRCKKADSKFILNELNPSIEENFEIYHYEFKNANPRVQLNEIKSHRLVCIFYKGFYEYSKSKNYFDFNECLMVTWSKFTPGYRWKPWGFEDNKIGFIQIDKNQELKKDKTGKRDKRGNVDITNYKYSYDLKNLELLVFSFHKTSDRQYRSNNIKLPFKYKR